VLKKELERLGFEVIDPWERNDPVKLAKVLRLPYGEERRRAWQELNPEIGARNQRDIDGANMVVAVLDGVDVDSGTAAEIGYAFAKQKTIVGYRGDFRLSSDNEGATVNLQVEYFIRASGGDIVLTMTQLSETLMRLQK
jgi:nucleoside 2-deoxyribosyltransferase